MDEPFEQARPAGVANRAPSKDLGAEDRARLVVRDEAALERFYLAYFDRIYGYVRRLLREEHLAEDVTQDIFMHIHKSLPSYDPSRELRPWVFTIATNKVRDLWRSRLHQNARRELGSDDDEHDLTDLAVSPLRGPSEVLEAGEVSETVAGAIEALPENMRTVLLLRYYEGLSFERIGAIVDRNETAVRKRYSRALEVLRGLLAKALDQEQDS